MYAGGETVAGYTLVRRLGEGGMGEIWEAVRQTGPLELRVALKVAFPQVLKTEEGRALFEREAALCGTLRHPNIAAIVDADFDKGVILYELVDGADLRAVLNVGTGNMLELPILTSILIQICKGLNHAHGRTVGGAASPVIHRDLSPGNVVIDYDGNVKVVDFGIAKAIAASERSKTIKGKLSYMAPEQAEGQNVDGRTDQYALGVIAYEALAGQRPNDGSHEGETLGRLLSGQHQSIQEAAPQVPSGIASIIERMLSLRPADRFEDLNAVIDALEPFSPPLAVHRNLATLVHKARPPRTILLRDGKYLSVPVSELKPAANLGEANTVVSPSGEGATQNATPTHAAGNRTANRAESPKGEVGPAPHATGPVPVPPPAATRSIPAPPSPGPRAADGLLAAVPPAIRWAAPALLMLAAVGFVWLQGRPAADKPLDRRPSVGAARSLTARPAAASVAPLPTAQPAAKTGKPPELAGPQATAVSSPDSSPPANPALAGRGSDSNEASARALDVAPTGPEPRRHPSQPHEKQRGRSARGVLQVGVFPQSQVWIDGKAKGRSPLVIDVRPGKHTVGAGQREAVVERRVRVRAGEIKKIFLELRNQQANAADTAEP